MFSRIHDKVIGKYSSINGKKYDSFVSADYLSLAKNKAVKESAVDAIHRYGTSFSVGQYTDRTPLHEQLTKTLAEMCGGEECVVTASGYVSNLVAISHLSREIDVFLVDELAHNSILTATNQIKSTVERYTHNDLAELKKYLVEAKKQSLRICVVTETVFSADGDCANLDDIASLKSEFDFTLYVDAAHSLGVFLGVENGLPDLLKSVNYAADVVTGSLSKSFASCGGYVVGSNHFIKKLSKRNGYYLFSTGIAPSNVASALTAIEVMRNDANLHQNLYKNILLFLKLAKQAGLNLGKSSAVTPIFTVIVNSSIFDGVYEKLLLDGFHVQGLKFPAVERAAPRLRILLNSDHDDEQIKSLVISISEGVNELSESQS